MTAICVFGDSVTRGIVLDSTREKYTCIRQSCANLFAGATGVRLDNHSIFGCTVTKGLQVVRRHIDQLADYDYVALEFGGNDCNYTWAEIAEDPGREHLPQTPPSVFRDRYAALIRLVRENGGRPVLLNLPPLDARRFFSWTTRGLCAENVLQWLGGDVEFIFRWHEGYNTMVEELARESDTPLIDIRGAFLQKAEWRDMICQDGMHPNEAGHRVISAALQAHARERRLLA